jgi:hypothetical protein
MLLGLRSIVACGGTLDAGYVHGRGSWRMNLSSATGQRRKNVAGVSGVKR